MPIQTPYADSVDSRSPQASANLPPAVLAELVAPADVRFNGARPWDIRVHDPDLYRQILSRGSLGLGEAYVAGAWDSEQLDETFNRLLRADIDVRLSALTRLRSALWLLQNRLFNRQSRRRAFHVGKRHYDLGNALFEEMLDPTMSYSCGYWREAQTLEQAQQAKLRLSCDKLKLQPGQRLLDIGCGWGGLARFAAEHYGVEVVGITVSKEQARLARERCAGLPVTIRLQDYREIEGRFDRIVSVGMFEHVGPKNYPPFFATADRALEPDGLFLLHTIGSSFSNAITDRWIEKYIFPNGHLPGVSQLTDTFAQRFRLLDWHNFGPDYDPTLMAWWRNFKAAWPHLQADYDQRFFRLWSYFLLMSAGFFRSGRGQLWQLVLTKRGFHDVYRSIR